MLSHYWPNSHIKMHDEQKLEADLLPSGRTPLWVDVPGEYSKRDILEKISELPEISNLSVTVTYRAKDRNEEVVEFCQEKGWKNIHWIDMTGYEDECVIVLDSLVLESISRPHNLLVVVTTPGHEEYEAWTTQLRAILSHAREDYECQKEPDCPYIGQTLLEKRQFPDVGETDQDYHQVSAIFRVSPGDKSYYDKLFDELEPQDGKVSVVDMRKLLDKVNLLPDSTLNKIFHLSDEDGDGLLDRDDFTVGAHLIIRAMCGEEIPQQVSKY